jgi:hypothetical protein
MENTESAVSLPASWYPDPDNLDRLRWWDGSSWTEHVQQLPPPPVLQSVAAPMGENAHPITEGFVLKKELPPLGTWYAETGNKFVPRASRSVLPAAQRDANDDFDKDDDVGSRWTVESFLLAVLPAIAFGLEYFLTRFSNGDIVSNNPLLFWLVPALFLVANPLIAIVDAAALKSRNITTAPAGIIGLLPPVYLLLRAISVGSSSILPLILWCGTALVVYGPMQTMIASFFTWVSTH